MPACVSYRWANQSSNPRIAILILTMRFLPPSGASISFHFATNLLDMTFRASLRRARMKVLNFNHTRSSSRIAALTSGSVCRVAIESPLLFY